VILYNKIGPGYNITRKADPWIFNRLVHYLQPVPGHKYLEIGCGTGNYLAEFLNREFDFTGIDPSETMLVEARKKVPDEKLVVASSESIPFGNGSFSGAVAILTLHHWTNIRKGLEEISRVLKPSSPFVVFSFTPEQMRGYWLYHYFPRMIEQGMKMVPPENEMREIFESTGFDSVKTEKYFIRPDLEDHFLYSHKHNPGQYLREEVRAGSSSFKSLISPEELDQGLHQLEADIHSKKIDGIIRSFENKNGDYLFYSAKKQ
jgi:ubiquinone/menaquinone biosynthesis C-methylase UbiE